MIALCFAAALSMPASFCPVTAIEYVDVILGREQQLGAYLPMTGINPPQATALQRE